MATQSFSLIVRNCTSNVKAFQTITRRFVQSGPSSSPSQEAANAAKRGLNETLRTGENLKNQAASTTEQVVDSAANSAQSVAGKVKQVWVSAKETVQRTIDEVKEEAKQEAAKRNPKH